MQSREEMSNETMETGNGSDRKFCTGGGNAASTVSPISVNPARSAYFL